MLSSSTRQVIWFYVTISHSVFAVTEAASEILGKHCQKKTPWVTAEIPDLCDKRRDMRKKRFESEGSEKYKEVNNNIKRCT